MVAVVVISGPVGVGKTAVAAEVGRILVRRGVAHAVIDLDALTATHPRPADDPFGSRLALANLQDVWRNASHAGARNLIVARVVETAADVDAIRTAVGVESIAVCRLRAGSGTLEDRIRRRETGSGLAWHLHRAQELAQQLEHGAPGDHVIETDSRGVEEVAEEVVACVFWK